MMTGGEGMELVQRFFPGTGSSYDHIVNLCTLGFDSWWKRKILGNIPAGAACIMDQACGTGILTFKMAEKFPRARIVGVDVTKEYLEIAKGKAKAGKVRNVDFILGRAEDVLMEGDFDCIVSSYLAKYTELGRLVPNLGKMLRRGGVLVMHDFTYPSKRPYALAWELYFKVLQTAGSRRYPQWQATFDDLPGLLRETDWVSELSDALRRNLFSNLTVQSLTFGAAALVTATKGLRN